MCDEDVSRFLRHSKNNWNVTQKYLNPTDAYRRVRREREKTLLGTLQRGEVTRAAAEQAEALVERGCAWGYGELEDDCLSEPGEMHDYTSGCLQNLCLRMGPKSDLRPFCGSAAEGGGDERGRRGGTTRRGWWVSSRAKNCVFDGSLLTVVRKFMPPSAAEALPHDTAGTRWSASTVAAGGGVRVRWRCGPGPRTSETGWRVQWGGERAEEHAGQCLPHTAIDILQLRKLCFFKTFPLYGNFRVSWRGKSPGMSSVSRR